MDWFLTSRDCPCKEWQVPDFECGFAVIAACAARGWSCDPHPVSRCPHAARSAHFAELTEEMLCPVCLGIIVDTRTTMEVRMGAQAHARSAYTASAATASTSHFVSGKSRAHVVPAACFLP